MVGHVTVGPTIPVGRLRGNPQHYKPSESSRERASPGVAAAAHHDERPGNPRERVPGPGKKIGAGVGDQNAPGAGGGGASAGGVVVSSGGGGAGFSVLVEMPAPAPWAAGLTTVPWIDGLMTVPW